MSAVSLGRREGRPSEIVAGFLAAAAIFVASLVALNVELELSGVTLGFRPVRLGVAAEVVALVAAGMGGRHARLAAFAVGFCALCWVVGMVVAVFTNRPLY